MKRLQTHKFALKPNGQQQRDMRRFAGACRLVFNKALAWQIEQYAADNTIKACADTSPVVGASGQEPTEATQAIAA
jgi:transposase